MGAQEFITTSHKEHNWPYPKPIVGRPCEPPKPTQEARKAPPAVAPYCHCDSHAYDPQLEQYKQLVDKEKKLCSDYDQLRAQMVAVTNDILDHPCDDANKKMATIYNMDFKRRSFPITDYRALVASAQSPAEIPRPAFRIGRLRCYKDPTTFVHQPVVRPTIHPPAVASLGVTPETVAAWSAEFPGRTEYQDTYSRCAKATWRATQRYREPMPSTRRREDDPCL